jgi:hypothetical protein
MPDAEDLRLQSLYERAVRSGDQSGARALFDQMLQLADIQAAQRRAARQERIQNAPPAVESPSVMSLGDSLNVPDYTDIFEEMRGSGIDPDSIGLSSDASTASFQNFLNNTIQNFDPQQQQRIRQFAESNPNAAQKIFEVSSGVGSSIKDAQGKVQKVKDKAENFGNFLKQKTQQAKDIFAIKNPVVEPGSIISGGTRLNPEAANWLYEQSKNSLDLKNNRSVLPGIGGSNVNIANYGNDYDISFTGVGFYTRPKELKQNIQEYNQKIQEIENKIKSLDPIKDLDKIVEKQSIVQSLREGASELADTVERAKNPLVSNSISYQLGRGIEAIPTNSIITASPIGGPKGERARLYRAMSRGALETNPDLNLIQTQKTGPTSFVTFNNKDVEWDPATLKDPMIRSAFNMPTETDVSALRADPMSQFINTRPIDFNRPVITTSSPQYVTRQAIKSTAAAAKPVARFARPTIGAIGADAAINFALGESPVQAGLSAVTAPFMAENLGGTPTANITRLGPQGQFVDMRTNTVIDPRGQYTNQGVAFKGGKPVLVPRGSVAGEGNILTQTRDVLGTAANVWKGRLKRLGIPGF